MPHKANSPHRWCCGDPTHLCYKCKHQITGTGNICLECRRCDGRRAYCQWEPKEEVTG